MRNPLNVASYFDVLRVCLKYALRIRWNRAAQMESWRLDGIGKHLLASTTRFNGDNVRLDLSVDRAPAEPLGDGFRRDIGCFAEPRGIAGLDLVP